MTAEPLLTFGHGTADAETISALLRDAGVALVVDVRRFPGSRRHPHVARTEMEAWLPAAGVAYRWDARLGGRRGAPDGRDTWWRVTAFAAYAAHMRTDEFRAGLEDLLTDVRRQRTAVLCSESLWWRCHRRLVSDAAVLLGDVGVAHLGHDGRLTAHEPSAGVRVTPEGLVYDG